MGEISFKDRCKATGVDYWRALKRRAAGMPEEKIFSTGYVRSQRVTSTAVTVNGVFYPSIRAACVALDPPANETTIERWIKKGVPPEVAFVRIPNPGYRTGIIYCVTHVASGKRYVGLTVQTLERRWTYHLEQASAGLIKGAGSLHAAIREFGSQAFLVEQLDVGQTKHDLESKERDWIRSLRTMAPAGFNLHTGGVSGGSAPKSVVIDGVRFNSVLEAAMHVAATKGISLHAAKKRLHTGRINVKKLAKPGESQVKTKAYKAWSSIIHGAMNPISRDYIPGLQMHAPWREFHAFLEDVGHPTSRDLCFTRINKADGVFPSNCRWMTKSEASVINAAYMKSVGKLTGRRRKAEGP